jgi:CheY-like chemotaxis protein
MFEVLLIEENAAEAERIRDALKAIDAPNNLTTVPDAEDALDLLRMNAQFSEALRPDVVVLDLNLLSTGRTEVLEELKSHEALRSIPVVVLTRPNRTSDMKRAYNLDVTHFVTMPDQADGYVRVAEMIADLVTYSRLNRPATS